VKKVIFRILALVFDLILINLCLTGIGMLPMFNDSRNKIQDIYGEVSAVQVSYKAITNKLEDYLKDSIISTEEMEEINKDFKDYSKVFKHKDVELSDTEKDAIKEDILAIANSKISDLSYKVSKNDVVTTIIGIVMYVLYFGVVQFLAKGQTLGKKLFKVKVFSNTDKDVSLLSYIARSLLMTMSVLTIVNVICLVSLNKASYLGFAKVLETVTFVYEMAFLVTFMLREDTRSVHDILLNTRVSRIDKEGNEIEETPIKKEEVVETKKEEVKELKSTPKKKAKKKSEKTSNKNN
jgi:uncharacterized RDD family membrane protein YckC